jgi:hypothetical protein
MNHFNESREILAVYRIIEKKCDNPLETVDIHFGAGILAVVGRDAICPTPLRPAEASVSIIRPLLCSGLVDS